MNQINVKYGKAYGTREWAVHSVNCCTGCSHDCRYCYARAMAVKFNRVCPEDWKIERVRQWAVKKRYPKMEGTVMFPSTHDITPGNFVACYAVLSSLLEAGNRVLVVSKPHFHCIETICLGLHKHRDRILFRFTIGARDNQILSFWEPNAPSYDERKGSLELAYRSGYATSVSAEPLLDIGHVDDLIDDLSPFITNSIWIGKMNDIRVRVAVEDERTLEEICRIEAGQDDRRILQMVERHRRNRLIKWKSSIKRVAGLPICNKPGMDI